jgi:hypothetical protein
MKPSGLPSRIVVAHPLSKDAAIIPISIDPGDIRLDAPSSKGPDEAPKGSA